MTAKLSIVQMREKLEELFTYTSDLALGKGSDFVGDVRVAAAQASAQIADVLLEIYEVSALGVPLDSDGSDSKDPLQ